MARIVFPVSSAPGTTPQEGNGRLLNAYAVKQEQGSRAPLKWLRSAGLRQLFVVAPHVHFRGGIEVASTFIVVMNDRVHTATKAGDIYTTVNRGSLSGEDAVTIARNNAATPNIVCVSQSGTFNLFSGAAPTSFADADLPAVNSVCPANGYLVFSTAAGQLWASELNSVDVHTNSFEDAQMELRRVVFFRGQVFAMGETGIKVYDETGESPFPFRYNKSVGIIPAGICGTHAVAGFEDGWVGQLLWVAEDNTVRQLDGYAPKVVSNDAVTRLISSASDRTKIEASVYMNGQHAFFVITSPGEWTWELNVTTGSWNERESYLTNDWRGRRCIRVFDQWVAGDYTTGRFANIDNTFKYEYTDALTFHLESGDNAVFPNPVQIPSAHFDFSMGMGLVSGEVPIETNPVAMISWSMNAGDTWGNELTRSLGTYGQGNRSLYVHRIGTTKSKGIRFKIRVSDPINLAFLGGEMPDVKPMVA